MTRPLHLGRGAPAQAGGDATPFVPPEPSLRDLRNAATRCTACPLYANATQTVFGDGRENATVMLVGEQPGDQEDLQGKPFVGPAGRLLDRCLEEAGIRRADAYITNAVKHFKWIPRGKRRIHSKPNSMEIRACAPWIQAEIHLVQPKVLVCLGATAAQALLGASFRVTRQRGKPVPSNLARFVVATVHPSALLRAQPEQREAEVARFVDDLKVVADLLGR